MTSSAPAKILIGISLDVGDSTELLSWAIKNLAHPNDTVVALHVLVGKAMTKRDYETKRETKKWKTVERFQTQIRRAKAFVISVMGEFAKTCQAKQVNLEARVGFGSSIGKCLVEEAQGISVKFLVIGSSRNRSKRAPQETTRYCFDNHPKGCSLILVARSEQPEQNFHSHFMHKEELKKLSSRWSEKSTRISNSSLLSKSEESSPKTVLNSCEGESSRSTEEDISSIGESSITASPLPLSSKGKSHYKSHMSPLRSISSFLRSSFSLSERKTNEAFPVKEKQPPLLRCFSYEEIAYATNNFNPEYIVGIGGYSEVYRGDLDDGTTIAVKRLAKDNTDQNKEKEFLMELGIIGHVDHPNTASLVGCCIEKGLYLIFNFYPNGTLSSALHGKTGESLEWAVRYKIAVGIARGLHYLHKCCKHRIIHRDIKASNVLLGPDYEPQISDFGLAKWLPTKWSHHAVIPIEGTFGYLAPEYFMHGIVDEKTDVFAFGILLLEIITGRKPVDSSQQNLLLWAKPLMEAGNIAELADPSLEFKYDMDQISRLVLTASYCVRQSSIWRPSMAEVLELLAYGLDCEAAESWRIPKFTSDDILVEDHSSFIFGNDLSADIVLEDV